MKHKGLLVLFTLFLFVFALSVGAQAYINSRPSAWELERQQWLQKEYGVSSFEELRAKYEREAYERVQASMQEPLPQSSLKEHLLQMQSLSVGTSTYNDIQTVLDRLQEEEQWTNEFNNRLSSATSAWELETPKEQSQLLIGWGNFNPLMELSVLSLTSMGFVGALMVPRIDRKLKGKYKFILTILIVSVWVFFAGYHVGYAVAQSSEITIEKGSFQTGTSYVIFQDGELIKARDQWGNIAFSGTDANTVIQSVVDWLSNCGDCCERLSAVGVQKTNGKMKIKLDVIR